MTVQRSRWCFNRPTSLAYLEILLEALIVLVIATELSLDCSARLFPEWHENEFAPRQKTGFVNLFLTTWQETVALSSDGLVSVTAVASIDRTSMSLGSIILIGTAGAFYLVFTIFLFVNLTWKPPVFHPPEKHLMGIQVPFSGLLFMVSIPQAVGVVYLVLIHAGWIAVTGDWMTFTGLSLLYLSVISSTALLFCIGHFKANENQSKSENINEGDKYTDFEPEAPGLVGKAHARQMCNYMAIIFFFCIWEIAEFLIYAVIFLAMLSALAITPAVPVLIWGGISRCLMAFCGTTAAFYGSVLLACLLIMYSSGRMLGIWMAGSNVAWIVDKIRSLTGCKGGLQEIFPVKSVRGNYLDKAKKNPFKRRFDLALNWLTIAVLSHATWSASAGGIIRAYGDVKVLYKIREWTLTECTSSILSKLFIETNATTCVFLNETISPLETRIVTIGYLLSKNLAWCYSSGSFRVMMVFMVYAIVSGMVAVGKKYWGHKKHIPKLASSEDEFTKMVNKAFGVFYLAPLSLVKIILAVYGLDFLLPGRLYPLGLAAWLLGCVALFCWKFVQEMVDWVRTLFARGGCARRVDNGKDHLIRIDDEMPDKLDVQTLPRNTAEVGLETEVSA